MKSVRVWFILVWMSLGLVEIVIASFYSEGDGSEDNLQFGNRKRNTRATTAMQCSDETCKNDAIQALRIPKGYNFFEIPYPPDMNENDERPAGINVTLKARVESIRDINEVTEEITLDMEITLGWIDWKILAYRRNMSKGEVKEFIRLEKHLEVPKKLVTINNPAYLQSIWKPNLYIYDLIERSQPKLMSDLITLKYDPDGGFTYYLTRVILKLSCPMQFEYYPADTQTCQFLIRGFSYNEFLLNLQWYKAPYLAEREESNFDVQLTDYHFTKIQMRDERFNGLSFNLKLRRKLSYHLVQTYIPSSFFILITWLCFLIPSSMVEARIGISMTTLLTLTAMFASVRETSPISSYVKALDVWMVSCIFSVFLTLLEFTILTWLRHLKSVNEDKEQKKGEETGIMPPTLKDASQNGDKFDVALKIVEKYAFAVFFILFVVYNVVYWSWLFNSSGFNDWPKVNTTLNIGDDVGNEEYSN